MESQNGETSAKNSRKRRFSESAIDDHPTEKSLKNELNLINNDDIIQKHFPLYSLLNFSDEILIIICKNLDHSTLLSLSKTCIKFRNFIYEKSLWNNVDLSNEPMMGGQLSFTLRYFTEDTKTLKIQGMLSKFPLDKWKNLTITKTFLQRLSRKCPSLEVLHIHEGVMDFNNLIITDFPKTLTSLIFTHCETLSPRRRIRFFIKIDSHFYNLEKLFIEECGWFETHDFISISKLRNLRKLSLKGCTTLRDCVPYCSLATRYGFKTLELLDVRDTPISDSDIQCFNVTNSLRELLMDCPEYLRNQTTDTNIPHTSNMHQPNRHQPELDNINIHNNIGLNNIVFVIVRDRRNPENAVLPDEPLENGERPNIAPEIRVRDRYIFNNVPERIHENDDDDDDDDDSDDDTPENIAMRRNRVRVYRRNEPGQMWVDRNNVPMEPQNPFYEHFLQLQNNSTLFRTPPLSLISDRGICSFGEAGEHIPDIVNIRMEYRSPNTFLEKLIVRNYKLVTNAILRHLSTCSPKLKLIDVTGTSITKEGITYFKNVKPDCIIISDFNDFV